MSQHIKREVLSAFKKLHRTREYVFKGDNQALTAARAEININFRKNIAVTDENEIRKLVVLAVDVDKELRTNVVQGVEKESGVYELNIRKEVPRLENVPFNPDAVINSKCGGADPKDGKI